MNKKPSFLERLTGVLDEEEARQNLNNSETEQEIQVETEENEEKPVMVNEHLGQAKKIKKITLPPEETPLRESEEWLPESEGQLTIDVYQTPADIIIKSTIAGVNPEDLDITLTNDM